MRALARLTAVVAAAGAALLVAAPPALAGGPTSVLLASPVHQRTASLYYSDTDYTLLSKALGDSPTPDAEAPPIHGGPGTSAINVTWLTHDVSVWRVDRIFTDVEGGPWVESLISYDGPEIGAPGVVHRPATGGLVELLGRLGLLGGAKAPQPAHVPVAAEQPVAKAPAATPATTPDVAGPDWLWLLVGLAAGAVIVVGLRPVVGLVRLRGRQRFQAP